MSWVVLVSVLVLMTAQIVVADEVHSPEPLSVARMCFYGGRWYRVGQKWKPEPCTSCRCNVGGKLECVISFCASPPCKNYIIPAGKCCPVCSGVND